MARRPGSAAVSAERTRKRFARRQWARRWLAWKYAVAALLLLAGGAGLVWLVYYSSLLSVKGVDVVGARQLRAGEVRAAAAVPAGESLARVDLDRIRTRVEAMAPVRSADVSRQWPDQVLITVEERVAVAVVQSGGRLRGMDEEGVIFRDFDKPPADLPRVETSAEATGEALREAALVIAVLPADLAAEVDHVFVATVDEISLVLRDGRDVRWGSAEDSETKAEVLAVLLQQKARHYDVSVPGQPTTSS